jgi:hypothetical protein
MFPYISTLDTSYSPQLVSLLSQMATWQILQMQEPLEKLLRGTNATVTPVATDKPSGSETAAGGGIGKFTSDAVMRLKDYGKVAAWDLCVCCWGLGVDGLIWTAVYNCDVLVEGCIAF